MKNLQKLESKAVKNIEAVKGGDNGDDGTIRITCDHDNYHDGKCVKKLKR